jgi:hypothetical protein
MKQKKVSPIELESKKNKESKKNRSPIRTRIPACICLRIWAVTFNSNIGLMRFKLGWKADSKCYNFVSNKNFLIRTYKGSNVAVK